MKNIMLILTCLLLVNFAPTLAQENPDLKIIYPGNEKRINADSTFFIGSTEPEAKLTINKNNVKVHPNGAFVHVVSLKNGKNDFIIKSKLKRQESVKKYVLYAPEEQKALPAKPLMIDKNSIKPDKELSYLPGDIINVEFKGAKSNAASFKIGDSSNILMVERIKGRNHTGIYQGAYRIQKKDNLKNSRITVNLSSKDKQLSETASGSITNLAMEPMPIVAEVITNNAIIRTAPDKSRLTPLPAGVRLNITGKEGDHYRFKMGEAMEGWIKSDSIKLLPQGTPVSESLVTSVSLDSTDNYTRIKLPLSLRLPFTLEQTANQMKLKLYGATADLNVLRQPPLDSYVQEIKWSQPFKDTFNITIMLNQPQSLGYSYEYENNTLVISIKKPNKSANAPLSGKVVTIDPGHGGAEQGSVGPTGIPEKNINLNISKFLRDELQKAGATVVMTREMDKDVSLQDRVQIAKTNNSDILVSVHNNALPDGHNPYKEHGSGTYYYHSQSLPLAKSIQRSMLEELKLRDNGVFWDSLALVRPNEQPSVLVEVGFMINPYEYALLTDEKFQKKAARSIFNGIQNFYRNQEILK